MFVEKYKKHNEDEFIYQSVIERFVRDVVEVLIRRSYSSEARLNKFVDEAEVFSGLVMFYNVGDANDGYKSQFLSVSPKNQPLLLSLVFHDYKDADSNGNSIINHIGNICKSVTENPEIIELVFSIVKRDPVGSIDAVNKVLQRESFKDCKKDEDFLTNISAKLRRLRTSMVDEGKNEKDNSTKKYDFDFTNKEKFKQQYKQYFGNTSVRENEDVSKFFEKDLDILRKFLIHASIPAIRLEKPFVAREVQSINKLLEAIDSREFDELINTNHKLLLPDLYESRKIAIDNLIANKSAVSEVEKIMKTLDVVS